MILCCYFVSWQNDTVSYLTVHNCDMLDYEGYDNTYGIDLGVDIPSGI